MTDFNQVYSRKGTGSVRWEIPAEKYGEPDIIPLTTADMDFKVAEPICQTLRRAVDFGILGYTRHTDGFYRAILHRFHKIWRWDIEREWIVHNPTVIAGIAACIQCMTEPGDGIVIPTPMYHPFRHLVMDNGRTLLESPLLLENGRYTLNFADLEKKLSAAKMLIFCNPHNPTGTAWTSEELSCVCQLCDRYGVIVISDEVHCDFIYSGHTFVSMGPTAQETSPAAAARLIVCSSGGKSFNLAGLQGANLVIPDEELRKKYQGYMACQGFHELNMMTTSALETAYTECDEWLASVLAYLEENRNFAVDYFRSQIPRIVPIVPEATYMLWLDCRGLGLTDDALEALLAHKAKVALNPGATFGTGGAGFVRMNFATPRSILQEALVRIRAVLE